MPKLELARTLQINAPIDKVFSRLNDFNHWKQWSPWLIMESNTKVDISADSKSYRWEGNRVGSGNMQIINEIQNESIDYQLEFLKPWKSKAKVSFNTKEVDGGTQVTWSMKSSLPFFMFFMKKMMTAFIGMDYERGLRLLKDYVEDGKIHSKLNFRGESAFSGCQYIGINTVCTMDAIGDQMSSDFKKLETIFNSHPEIISGNPFSIYHKWNVVKKTVKYTSGFPVNKIPSDLPSEFIAGSMPAGKLQTVEHIGPYHHLGNAWSTMHLMLRNKEFKSIRGQHPFETYENNPLEVEANELITSVHFPVK